MENNILKAELEEALVNLDLNDKDKTTVRPITPITPIQPIWKNYWSNVNLIEFLYFGKK